MPTLDDVDAYWRQLSKEVILEFRAQTGYGLTGH